MFSMPAWSGHHINHDGERHYATGVWRGWWDGGLKLRWLCNRLSALRQKMATNHEVCLSMRLKPMHARPSRGVSAHAHALLPRRAI